MIFNFWSWVVVSAHVSNEYEAVGVITEENNFNRSLIEIPLLQSVADKWRNLIQAHWIR